MDISEILNSDQVSLEVKQAVLEIVHYESSLFIHDLVLTPRASNDDLNGSQHVSGGGTDFTYEDASLSDFYSSNITLGVYDYFAREGDHYTGHSYNGEGYRFSALVVNPPAYTNPRSV